MVFNASVLRRSVIAASTTWAVILPVATYAAAETRSFHAWSALVALVYAIGHVICHQLSDRSFHLWGTQMPVCARCVGLYVGASAAALVAAGVRQKPSVAAEARHARLILLVAALPTVATLLYEWTTGQTPANLVRAAAGCPLGGAVAWVIVGAL